MHRNIHIYTQTLCSKTTLETLLIRRLTDRSRIDRWEISLKYTPYTTSEGSWLWYWSLSGVWRR